MLYMDDTLVEEDVLMIFGELGVQIDRQIDLTRFFWWKSQGW